MKSLFVAGLDEAGRGPLAGPVVAACVVLNPDKPNPELKDSKLLSHKQREILFDWIIEHAESFGIAEASVEEIDQLNIHHASLLAMKRAYEKITIMPHEALVDGKFCPALPCSTRAIVGGDKLVPAISAASILAKVTRDRLMTKIDQDFPHYGFAKHKGYPTKEHLHSLRTHGILSIHRRSYAPIKLLLEENNQV